MRAIDADDLMKIVKDLEQESGESADSFVNSAGHRSIELDRLEDYINNAETLEPYQMIYAHWVWNPNGNDWGIPAWTCSNCNCKNDMIPAIYAIDSETHVVKNPYVFVGSNFCPNCGAKMTGRKNGSIRWIKKL